MVDLDQRQKRIIEEAEKLETDIVDFAGHIPYIRK